MCIRDSPWKERKEVATDLKTIYQSATVELAEQALIDFSEKWDNKYPMISQSWYRHWDNIIPFFQFSPDIRRVIYSTNAIESLNSCIRRIIKTKGSFPNDDAVFKLVYLAIRNISKKWTMPIPHWKQALNQFAILFDDRLPKNF